MTLKVRILLFSTYNSKMTERPKIFLWPFSQFFGLTYQLLNSGACRKITLGTLTEMFLSPFDESLPRSYYFLLYVLRLCLVVASFTQGCASTGTLTQAFPLVLCAYILFASGFVPCMPNSELLDYQLRIKFFCLLG